LALSNAASITGAIADTLKDGRVMPDEAMAMLQLIEARRDAEESLIESLMSVAMKGKDHG
jgi:hypothetical protein